jgi:hypothetical protein
VDRPRGQAPRTNRGVVFYCAALVRKSPDLKSRATATRARRIL